MGMTYEQYWDGESDLVKFYREARKLEDQRINETAWLHGRYIYEVMADLYPAYNSNVKRGVKTKPYLDKPLDIGKDTKEMEEAKNDKKMKDGISFMEMFMAQNNRKFARKEADDHG